MARFSLNYESLKDLVYEYLHRQILTARLKPGDKIRETEICQALNISRTPVREALIKLEAEGFLTNLARRGFIVKTTNLKEIEDMYKTIGCLEGYAARMAAPRMRPEDLGMLSELDTKMREAFHMGKNLDFDRDNVLFHNVYLKVNQNDTINEIVSLLKKKIYDFYLPRKFILKWYEKALPEHAKILALFKRGDPEKLEKYIRDVHWNFEENLRYIREDLSLRQGPNAIRQKPKARSSSKKKAIVT
jgi:DNA-binding GntR family transcriptional regulator